MLHHILNLTKKNWYNLLTLFHIIIRQFLKIEMM